MKVIPIGDNVVVQRIESEPTTRGGIVLPDAAQDKLNEGRILSVGDGIVLASGERAPFQVSEGDRVLFAPYAGTELKIDGIEVLIMRESEILAVVT